MRAHLVQLDIAWEDREANFRRIESLVEKAPIEPGDLLALPEMFDSGFSLCIEKTADRDGASAAFLADLAQRLEVTVMGGVTAVGPDDMGRNRALAFGPAGATLSQYDKLHPFSFGRESERFKGGDRIVTHTWEAPGGRLVVCPIVCYDLRFPELFRAGLGLGAEAFVVMANWPAARAGHWGSLLQARAIENQAFVMGVNRCGLDPHLTYKGGSIAIGPRGEILAEAAQAEGVLTVEIEPQAMRAWRAEFPAWRDRRSELAPDLRPDGRLRRPGEAAGPENRV